MHLVKRDHFWLCDKDGDHTIRSAKAENTMLHANLMALFYRTRVTATRSFTLRE